MLRGQALENAETWAKGKRLSEEDYNFLDDSKELEKRGERKTIKLLAIGFLVGIFLALLGGFIAFYWYRNHQYQKAIKGINDKLNYIKDESQNQESPTDVLLEAIKISEKKFLGFVDFPHNYSFLKEALNIAREKNSISLNDKIQFIKAVKGEDLILCTYNKNSQDQKEYSLKILHKKDNYQPNNKYLDLGTDLASVAANTSG